MFAKVGREKLLTAAAGLLAVLAFVWFAHFRVRFVGGCDSAAYLVEAYRLRGVDVGLGPDPMLPFPRAFTPLCMVETRGIVHSLFPPGFSLLLAAGAVLGLEFYVTALFGAVGGFVLFLLARSRAGAEVALGIMIAWYAAPMTFWGSTQVMSDYVAANLVLLAVLGASLGRPFVAGLVLGFAVGVRPTCLLALPVLALEVKPRTWLAWLWTGAGLGTMAVGWGVFLWASFGTLDVEYAGNLVELRGLNFGHQLGFFAAEITRQYAPLVALAVFGLIRSPRAAGVYVVWFLPFVLLHALWRAPLEAWWQTRFVASGVPALFLAAAVGARSLWEAVNRGGSPRRPWHPRALAAAGGLTVAAFAGWSYASGHVEALRKDDVDERYASDVRRVARLVPRDALVGAVNHTNPLRLYGHLQSFHWCRTEVPTLIHVALATRRAVYAILPRDGENGCSLKELRRQAGFDLEERAVLPSGSHLFRLVPTRHRARKPAETG